MRPSLRLVILLTLSIAASAATAQSDKQHASPQRLRAGSAQAPSAESHVGASRDVRNAVIRETDRAPGSVTLTLEFPDPRFDSFGGVWRLAALAEQIAAGGDGTAVGFSIRAPRGARARIVRRETAIAQLPQPFAQPRQLEDVAKDGRPLDLGARVSRSAEQPRSGVSISYKGRLRGVDMSLLEFQPFAFSSGSLEWTKRAVIVIEGIAPEENVSLLDISEPFRATTSTTKRRIESAKGLGKLSQTLAEDDLLQTPSIVADDGNVYRMYVAQSGIYRVTWSDLRAFGLDPSTVDPNTLRLINQGQQVAVYVFDHQDGRFDENDYIEFYGEEKVLGYRSRYSDMYYDPYTHENAYFLVWGTRHSPIPAGGVKRMVEESGEIREARQGFYTDLRGESYPYQIHYERDQWNDPLDVSDLNDLSTIRDHYFHGLIFSGESITADTVAPFPDTRKNSPIRLRVGLHGVSHFDPGSTDPHGVELGDIPNENKAEILVNGRLLMAGEWDSQQLKFLSTDTTAHLVSGEIPTTRLLSVGFSPDSQVVNFPLSVSVVNRLDTACRYCRFAFNWFDLAYDRLYSAHNNEIAFSAPRAARTGLYQFTIDNFQRSDISVYRKGVSKISNVYISGLAPRQRGLSIIFQLNVASDQDQFIAVSDSNKLKPIRYVKDDYLRLRSTANGAGYLIVTSREHLAKFTNNRTPVHQIAELRERGGLKTKVVDVANIYDEFNFGARSPESIRDFISYAYHNWQEPPRYVLLVGTTKGLDVLPGLKIEDQVPAPYIQMYLSGRGIADAWYGMVDGDDLLPDVIVGRIPAEKPHQVQAYLLKMARYERDELPSAQWKNRSLFVSGNYAFGSNFPGQIDSLLDVVPRRAVTDRLGLNTFLPFYGTDADLVNRIDQGLYYLHFMGHGGYGVWADPIQGTGRPLFVAEDAGRLRSGGGYPFVTSLTCFTGAFDGTQANALLPNMLLSQDGGAIGALGTASFGFRDGDFELATTLLPHVYDTLVRSFGDRITAGKIDYFIKYGKPGRLVPPTLMYCYSYLGDPAVTPAVQSGSSALVVSDRAAPAGATVTVSGVSALASGTARVELVDARNSPLDPRHLIDNIPVANGRFTATTAIPSTVSSPFGSFKVTVADGEKRFSSASADVAFTSDRITELRLDPYPVPALTGLVLSAAVQIPAGVTSVTANLLVFRQDGAGIEQQIDARTLPMQFNPGTSRYEAVVAGAALQNGLRIEATVSSNDGGGNTTVSAPYSAIVGASADPAAYRDPLHPSSTGRYRVTPAGIVWRDYVYNWGSATTGEVHAELKESTSGSAIATAVTSAIPAHSVRMIDMPISPTSLSEISVTFGVSIADQALPRNVLDSTASNNLTRERRIAGGAVGYAKALGSTIDGATHVEASFEAAAVTIDLIPGALGNNESEVILVGRSQSEPKTAQPDIHFARLATQSGQPTNWTLRVTSDSLGAIPLFSNAGRKSTLKVRLDLQDSATNANLERLHLYRLDDRSQLWSILETSRQNDILVASLDQLGTFAIGYHDDTKSPLVDLTVEGQVFTNRGDVPEKPRFTAVMQDANGIDISPGKTILKLDNRIVDPKEYALLDSLRTSTTVSLRYEPQLAEGRHTLAIQTTDNNGLKNEETLIEVNVSREFKVYTLGSYPNPFATQMFLAYEIKGIAYADEVAFDIYTVSGRHVRSLKFPSESPDQTFGFLRGGTGVPTGLGYHEVWWDGRDDGGAEVANGAYFYRLKVTTPNDVRDITGKFARVR